MTHPRQALIRANPKLEGFAGPFSITEQELQLVFPGIQEVVVDLQLPAIYCDGHAKSNEYKLIAAIVKYLGMGSIQSGDDFTVFEFGGLDGLSALQIALNSPENSKIFTVTLPEDEEPLRNTNGEFNREYFSGYTVGKWYQASEVSKKITQLFADSANLELNSALNGRKLDLALIDGCHSYEYTKNDTEKALEQLKTGGVLVWHDFAKSRWTGVTDYITEFARLGNTVYWFGGPYGNCLDIDRNSIAFYVNQPEV